VFYYLSFYSPNFASKEGLIPLQVIALEQVQKVSVQGALMSYMSISSVGKKKNMKQTENVYIWCWPS
jgi:hypothetical protein